MTFSNQIQVLFKTAGWKAGRDVSAQIILPYDDYPQQALDFLKEYGGLKANCVVHKIQGTVTSNQLVVEPETSSEALNGDDSFAYYTNLIGKKLFPIAYYMNDGYDVCCDADGKVFMIGEYCYYWGESIEQGIENIMNEHWRMVLKLDEDNGKWWNMKGDYADLP